MFPEREFADLSPCWLELVFMEKGADRQRTELNADHLMSLAGDPEQIQAFPAQRDKNPVFCGQPQIWPEFDEMRIHRLLMKGYVIVAPRLLPKLVIAPGHGGSIPSDTALLNQENVLIERHNASLEEPCRPKRHSRGWGSQTARQAQRITETTGARRRIGLSHSRQAPNTKGRHLKLHPTFNNLQIGTILAEKKPRRFP